MNTDDSNNANVGDSTVSAMSTPNGEMTRNSADR